MKNYRVTRCSLGILVLLLEIPGSSASDGSQHLIGPFPRGFVLTKGWHVDASVKRAVLDGDFTSEGSQSRAILLTDGKSVRLIVIHNFDKSADFYSSGMRTYLLYEGGRLKSNEGIALGQPADYWLPIGYVDICGSKWITCNAEGAPIFHPQTPVLQLIDGDDLYSFQWMGAGKGFRLLPTGD